MSSTEYSLCQKHHYVKDTNVKIFNLWMWKVETCGECINLFQTGCHFEPLSISFVYSQLLAFCCNFAIRNLVGRPFNYMCYVSGYDSFCWKTNVAWDVWQTPYDWKGLNTKITAAVGLLQIMSVTAKNDVAEKVASGICGERGKRYCSQHIM